MQFRRFSSAGRRQHGQALIYGLFMLFAGLAGLYFLFNTGQIVRAKTKLVTTADAAAYGGGLMHARALNYHAYINRALMADEVLIAQAVSMASWASYMGSWSKKLMSVHPECKGMSELENGNYYLALVSLALSSVKFGLDYAFACGIMEVQFLKDEVIPAVVDIVPYAASQVVVPAAEVHKSILRSAGPVLDAQFLEPGGGIRRKVMQAVADANYEGDGEVVVDPVTSIDDWVHGPGGAFVKHYSGDERTRFKEVAVNAAHSDSFVKERRWTSKAILPLCVNLRLNEVRRRGGTEMLGFDEWHAVDTQSYHKRKRRFGICRGLRENAPTGYAQQEAYDSEQQEGYGARYGGSPTDNSAAHMMAVGGGVFGFGGSGSGSEKIDYSGLPSYYDINASWFSGASSNNEPVLRHAVRLTRARDDLHTTDASGGQIRTRSDSRIAAYDSTLAGGVMAAVSGTETFFERPQEHQKNVWGVKRNKPVELGSLFNPYWHTRLVEGDVAAQWLRQGVGRP